MVHSVYIKYYIKLKYDYLQLIDIYLFLLRNPRIIRIKYVSFSNNNYYYICFVNNQIYENPKKYISITASSSFLNPTHFSTFSFGGGGGWSLQKWNKILSWICVPSVGDQITHQPQPQCYHHITNLLGLRIPINWYAWLHFCFPEKLSIW